MIGLKSGCHFFKTLKQLFFHEIMRLSGLQKVVWNEPFSLKMNDTCFAEFAAYKTYMLKWKV